MFSIVNHLDLKRSQIAEAVMEDIFRKCFAWFGELGPNPFAPKAFLVFYFLKILSWIELLNISVNLLKIHVKT